MAGERHVLVIGGQRSGKSAYAESLVLASGLKAHYLATATVRDAEMGVRVAEHKRRRDGRWTMAEEPLELPAKIGEVSAADRALLVDCLTLWLSNLFEAGRPPAQATGRLIESLASAPGPVVLVSNEVGSGVIPDNRLARQFADALGVLNQTVADAVARVVVMTAGLPHLVKPNPMPDLKL